MMKEVLHKIGSVIMAMVVLFSTMSFTVDMHYCGDMLVDSSIFQPAESCGMELGQKGPSTDCSIVKKNCCSKDQLKVSGQDELSVNSTALSFDQQLFIATFVYTDSNLFEEINTAIVSIDDYVPPLVSRELYKLDETYLI